MGRRGESSPPRLPISGLFPKHCPGPAASQVEVTYNIRRRNAIPFEAETEHESNVTERVSHYQPRPSWRSWLLGRSLATSDAPHQTLGKAVALAVFGADALSSIAYAPQEMLVILAAAGAFSYALPIAAVIVVLLTIVTISYQQTIHAFLGGGAAYT